MSSFIRYIIECILIGRSMNAWRSFFEDRR